MSGNSIESIVENINAEIATSYNVPKNFFVCKSNKDSVSVYIAEPVSGATKKLAFNYKKGRKHTVTVKNSVISSISVPESAECKNRASDRINTYVAFTELNEEAYFFIRDVVVDYVKNFEPSDRFGCCSKYKACSEAKKCLHDNQFYARACWYKKNLEAGKIFY